MPTTVYFATNRALTGDAANPDHYSPGIQPPGVATGLVYGRAVVGGIDANTDPTDWTIRIADTGTGAWPADTAASLSAPGRNLLVFLHGFYNAFPAALARAAFNREWLAASGNPDTDTDVIAFCWPSRGELIGFPVPQGDYLHDANMARLSGLHAMSFLASLAPILSAARDGGCRAYLLAHSMGNLVLEYAVQQWFLYGNRTRALFDCAVLAAGDCNAGALTEPHLAGLAGLPSLAERVSVYFSNRDEVLKLSQLVNLGVQRLGQDGPLGIADATLFPPGKLRTVDAGRFRDYPVTFLSSHQYYRQSPEARLAIAADMAAGLATM